MRIYSFGNAAALLVASAIPGPHSAAAQAAPPLEVESWRGYGTATLFERDAHVPGGNDLRIMPRTEQGDVWSSGAGVVMPKSLRSGERVTAAFWARSDAAASVPVTIQGGPPAYTSFAVEQVALKPLWRRVTISGIAPADLPPGSQSVTVQSGAARSPVSLGPVVFLSGTPDAATIDRAFAGFKPDRIAEEVRIASDGGVVLAGTLRTPVGHGSGPFPLAIVIQGHGPNGRGGYDVLMKRLLADGIATLEYDKRGISLSSGTYSEDQDALTRDASAAVAAMRRRPDIDAARIALVGHSQGGAIAPAVAAADPRIAAVVTFAGPVGDGLDLFRRSMRDQLMAAGHPAATVAPLADASAALIQARVDRAAPSTIASLQAAVTAGFVANGFTPDQAAGALAAIDRDEIYQITRTHIASDLRSLHMPVLALFASLDPLVTAPGNAAAARAALANNPAAKVVVLDGVSHWFKEGAKTGSEAENAGLGPNLGSPRAVALAGDWLRHVLVPAAAGTIARR